MIKNNGYSIYDTGYILLLGKIVLGIVRAIVFNGQKKGIMIVKLAGIVHSRKQFYWRERLKKFIRS